MRLHRNCLIGIFAVLLLSTVISFLRPQLIANFLGADAAFTPQQRQQIEAIVADYLANHADLLQKNTQAAESGKYSKKQLEKLRNSIAKNKKQIFKDDPFGRIVLGNPNGDLHLIVVTQHQCATCHQAEKDLRQLIAKYPQLRVQLVFWPFLGDDATYTARAVIAAQRQGKAEFLNQKLFDAPNMMTAVQFDQMLQQENFIDLLKLRRDMQHRKIPQALKRNFNLAVKLRLPGTPVFFLADNQLKSINVFPEYHEGFLAEITPLIEQLIKK